MPELSADGKTTEPAIGQDTSIYDLADFLWAYKWLLALGLAIGLAVGAVFYFAASPPQVIRTAIFDIYPDGSPSYGAVGIADQLTTALVAAGYEVTSARGGIQVTAELPEDGSDSGLLLIADELEAAIDAQAAGVLSELGGITDGGDEAVTHYLQYKSYADGRAAGTVDLIASAVTETRPRDTRSLLLVTAAVTGLVAALVLAALIAFAHRWRRRRAALGA